MSLARPRLAYLIDPRFRGGTASSFLAEIAVTARHARVSVNALSGGFLEGRPHGPIENGLAELGLALDWDGPVIAADVVVIQNPVFLCTCPAPPLRIVARTVVVVTHENFLRPAGEAGFDLGHALDLIDRASVAMSRLLAPVSPHNRAGVSGWLGRGHLAGRWRLLPEDWTNVVSGPLLAPTDAPRDRRGRLSREGLEKFPPLADMDLDFPAHAETNLIMGADLLGQEERSRRHWRLLPFGALPVDEFFGMIDFMVYRTAPTWTESFGRVIAEAICAGKVVIAGPEARSVFGEAVVVALPGEVDRAIAGFLADPESYRAQVRRAQAVLMETYGDEAFLRRVSAVLTAGAPG